MAGSNLGGMVTQRLTDEEVLELARAFYRQNEILSLLERAGLDRSQQPGWSGQSAQEYWRAINRLVESEQLADGRLRILTEAQRDFRANQTFIRGIEQASAAALAPRGVLLAVDSVARRPEGTLVPVDWRLGLATIVEDAARRCGLAAGAIVHRQRDTDLIGLVADDATAPVLVGAFTAELAGALATYNGERLGAERVRLRLALHVADGTSIPVSSADADAVFDGPAAALTHRLVDTPGLSQLLRAQPTADLVVIVSSSLYETTVRATTGTTGVAGAAGAAGRTGVRGLDPAAFREVAIELPRDLQVSPAMHSAWVTVPRPEVGARAGRPVDSSATDAPRPAADAENRPWDYLISVADKDTDWGAWIAWELEQRGLLVHLQAWDVVPGNNPVIQMDQAIQHAEKTLVVLSENYLRAPEVQAQWTAAWSADATGMKRRLVPVRVAECRPGGMLRGITCIDLVGLDDSAARAAFHRGIDAVITGRGRPDSAPPFPGPRPRS